MEKIRTLQISAEILVQSREFLLTQNPVRTEFCVRRNYSAEFRIPLNFG